ncbi:hypothetical protein E4417_13050 [Stenotrophomonas maltophilia]|uniref:AAA family ATPase n=1 Tax=Stenotrophomonas maltophilia TaxID=40324 RepID=UPI001094983A|nr:AAA family ATPase [Stenotrophomonas maltophilia]TGW17579.1 hypothetical protein E4417_13050 [Stenotrophomonas maltophilia]
MVINVLRELNFKEGIDLVYSADRRLSSLLGIANDKDGIERAFEQVLTRGQFVAGGAYIGREASGVLRDELRRVGVDEVAEYVRSSIDLIAPYMDHFYVDKRYRLERFVFRAFRGREAMSSDYPILQAFALLRRLGLLTLLGCTLTSYEGAAVDLTRTSSGQQQMLCSIFGLASALEDDAIVLIDEPELSLHPRWQMGFFKHLEVALEGVADCHVIIATHSPLIAQAGSAHGAEIVQMGSPGINEQVPLQGRRADASVEELLVDVFDTPIPNSVHISNEIFALVTRAETGTDQDRRQALGQLVDYLDLYRREGEGAVEMVEMLSKAIKLVSHPRSMLADGDAG